MSSISDDYMREMLGKTKTYTLVILHKTAKLKDPGMDKVVWEHGRRNFQLRKDGKLNLVGPVRDQSDVSGFYVFSVSPDEVKSIMEGDPGVQAGIFIYEIHPTVSFPGDALA